MSCKITKNPQGKTTGVKDQNGNDSTLFREIVSNPHINPEQGVEIYKQTFSDKIKTEDEAIIDNAKEKGTYLKAPNGKDTNLSPEQWVQVRTKAFKNWFGDWENNPSEASKVVDENGEPMVVYHGSPNSNIDEFNSKNNSRGNKSGLKEEGTYFTTNKNLANFYKDNTTLSKEAIDNINQEIEDLKQRRINVRNNNEWDTLTEKINALEYSKKGKLYPIFLNLKNIKEFDAEGKENVEAWNNLEVKASYKLATNRDAMNFLKEGRFGVEKVDGIRANNIIDAFVQGNEKLSRELLGDVFLVFDTTQGAIKSATENTGEFNPESDNIKFSMETPIWVDTAQEGLSEINQKSATPEQWVKMIADKGGKGTSQQLEWIGLKDFLNSYIKENDVKSIPRDVVEQYINDNQIEIVEVSKGESTYRKESDIDLEIDKIIPNDGRTPVRWYETRKKYGYKILETGEFIEVKDSSITELADEVRNRRSTEENDNVTKYSDYQLEGGENYREVLLTLPNKKPSELVVEKRNELNFEINNLQIQRNKEGVTKSEKLAIDDKIDKLQLEELNLSEKFYKDVKSNYKSSHWDESNILAHVRMNERTLPNGERVMFIEEVQSDWAQDGKKKGFIEKDKIEEKDLTVREEKNTYTYKEEKDGSDTFYIIYRDGKEYKEVDTEREAKSSLETLNSNPPYFNAIYKDKVVGTSRTKEGAIKDGLNTYNNVNKSSFGVSNMPYKKTDQWVGMAMRRVMQMASQEGFDRVAWVTGEQSADRYDLSKQIDAIDVEVKTGNSRYVNLKMPQGQNIVMTVDDNGGISESSSQFNNKNLEDVIGKELAKKVLDTPSNERVTIKEGGLKVGGEGMKTFYNSILPKVAKKEVQRFDKNAKIEVIEIPTELTFSSNKELASLPQPVIKLIDSVEEGSITEEEYHMQLNKLGYASSFEEGYVENVSKIDYNKSKQLSIKITPKIKEAISQGIPLFEKISGKNNSVAGNRIFNNPLEEVSSIADEYSEKSGISREKFEGISVIDKGRAKVISDLFDQMENNPNDPEVKKAYEKMAEETLEQYKVIVEKGYQVEVNNNEPYNNSQEMIEDLRENKNMKIFSTESGFGDEAITEKQRQENPLLRRTEFSDKNGVPLLVNDVFRFVHDFFGHAELGNGFGAIGEENAWNVHARMFSPLARRAMTTETRGQNSWVNFSGVNEEAFKKRNEARRLRREGKVEESKQLVSEAYEEMSFADQKVGLLPKWVSDPYAKIEFGNKNFEALTPKQQALFLGYNANPEGSKIVDKEGNFKYSKKTGVDVEDVIDRSLMTEEEQRIIDSSDIKTINMYGGRGIYEGLAFYNSSSKQIYINVNNKLGGVILTDQKEVNKSILHEYIHAVLDKEVKDREAFEKELSDIRKTLVDNKGKASSYVQNIIGHMESGSSEEVVTYMLTIKEVAEFMHSIPSDKRNTQRMTLWNKLLNLIKKVLKGKSLLEETTDILNKYTKSFWTKDNSEIFTNKLNDIKNSSLIKEDGMTFNKEREIAPNKGIVLPLISKNIVLEQLSDQAIEDFINENNDILINSDLYIGVYKFPNSNVVSLDINYVGSASQKNMLVLIAKELGQESLYDIENEKNIKTGETGENTKELTKNQISTLLDKLIPLKEENYIEPSLVYVTPTNQEFATFKEALQNTQTGEIKANIGNVTLFTIDSSTDYNTYNGTINGLIKSGILTGESVLEPTGEKVLLTEGGHNIVKTINAVIAKETLIKILGRQNVKETKDSNFILQDKVGKITLRNEQGENFDIEKELLDEGGVEALKKQFPNTYMEIVAMQEYKKLFRSISNNSTNSEEIEFTPENELQYALIELLNKMGVKITTITDYITNFARKNGVEPSASALADLANKIVAFKDGEVTTEDLSEEVAHFIVETFSQEEVENLLRNIHRTEEWQQHADNYYNLYRKNNPNITEEQLENLVRREVLGKVLANSFLKGFNTQNTSETQGNIINKLYDLFTKFIEKITARFKDSYKTELENWTNQINANLLSGELYDQLDMSQLEKGRFVMYSASKTTTDQIVQINIRANKALNVLQSNINNLRDGSSKSEIEQYRVALEKQDDLSMLSAVSGITSIVKRQTSYLKKVIEKNKKANYPLSQEENAVYTNTTGTMLGYMTEIKKILSKIDKKNKNFKSYKKVEQEIEKINTDILDLKGDKDILSDSAWEAMVERVTKKLSLTEAQTQTLLDAYIERTDKDGNKIGGGAKKDTNWFFAHVSSMVHAQDPALNMASDIISRMTMKHNINTQQRVKKFLNKLEELGFVENPSQLLKKWKRGSYLWNPIKQEELNKEVLKEKTRLYEDLTGQKLTPEEFDEKERKDELEWTAEERLNFYDEISEYQKKEHQVDYLTKTARAQREELYDGLSPQAVRRDRNWSRERGRIGREADKLNGYTQEHKFALENINKERQKIKSPYDQEGQLKNGLIEVNGEIVKDPQVVNLNKDAQMVLDLMELDKRKLFFFKHQQFYRKFGILKERPTKNTAEYSKLKGASFQEKAENYTKENVEEQDKIIPERFEDTLLEEDSVEKQLEFLLLNANISFTNEFWDELSQRDGFLTKLENLQDKTPEIESIITTIKTLQKKRSDILKANKVHNMPSEIDYSEMGGSEIEAIKDLSEQLQDVYKRAKDVLKDTTSEIEEEVFSSVTNNAYKAELEANGDNASKEQELEFIKKHVTSDNRRLLIKSQAIAEDVIAGTGRKLSDFYKTIFQDEYTGAEKEIREQVYSDLVEHAKGKLLPYFKRIEPIKGESFTSLMERLQSGQLTAYDFIQEVKEDQNSENKRYPQIQVTPNYIFYEQSENEDLNPDYARNEERGLPQIQEKHIDQTFQDHFGITEYGGQPSKNIEEYRAWEALVEFHEESLEATGMEKRHNKFLLPQKGVRGARQIHKLFSQPNKIGTLKEIVKDMTSFREDEKEYGETASGQVLGAKDGDLRIPKYGFNKIENQDDVTDELLESYVWMGSEAELYKARVEAFADMEAIKNLIFNTEYSGKSGEKSRVYKMFDSFYRFNIYGQNEEFSYETDLFGLLPKKYNIAPLAKKFQFWVRLVNLGFNLIVPLTSILQGGVNLTIERFVGERVDKDASKLARRELRKLLSEAVGDSLKLNSKSRLNSLGEFLGMFDIETRFKNSNYNRVSRGLLKSGFLTHTLADAPIKGQILMTVLKDMRVVEGDIINFNQFMARRKAILKKGESLDKKAIREEWRKYEDKTFDKYLTTKNGVTSVEERKLIVDLKTNREALKDLLPNKLQFIRDTIQRTSQEIDTMIPAEEKSFAQRHAIFSFFFLHRGWMAVSYNRKFKSRQINTHTGLTEEGNWWGTSDFIKKWINEWRNPNNTKNFFKTYKDMWDNADDTTRRSLNRTMTELVAANSTAVLALIMMSLADDEPEDAWMAQFSAYMGYRVSNEVISSTIAYPRQIGEFIESPIVAWDKLKGLGDIFDILDGTTVERGKYRGETERMRFIYKNLPAFKEYYNVKNAHDTRNTYEFYNKNNLNWAWSSYLIGQNKD